MPADAFKRIIYTESHDEDANGSARVPEEIWPGYADSWASKKRATLGSALVLTSPGIPMLFQGQELIEGSWFTDDDPLDWSLRHRHKGLLALHRDLIRPASQRRTTRPGACGAPTSGSTTSMMRRQDHRVASLGGRRSAGRCDRARQLLVRLPTRRYRIGVPRAGRWRVRFNSDWDGYDPDFATVHALDADCRVASPATAWTRASASVSGRTPRSSCPRTTDPVSPKRRPHPPRTPATRQRCPASRTGIGPDRDDRPVGSQRLRGSIVSGRTSSEDGGPTLTLGLIAEQPRGLFP